MNPIFPLHNSDSISFQSEESSIISIPLKMPPLQDRTDKIQPTQTPLMKMVFHRDQSSISNAQIDAQVGGLPTGFLEKVPEETQTKILLLPILNIPR